MTMDITASTSCGSNASYRGSSNMTYPYPDLWKLAKLFFYGLQTNPSIIIHEGFDKSYKAGLPWIAGTYWQILVPTQRPEFAVLRSPFRYSLSSLSQAACRIPAASSSHPQRQRQQAQSSPCRVRSRLRKHRAQSKPTYSCAVPDARGRRCAPGRVVIF